MATDWDSVPKIGAGWEYNEATYTYNEDIDPSTGAIINYNSAGTATVWTAISKP